MSKKEETIEAIIESEVVKKSPKKKKSAPVQQDSVLPKLNFKWFNPQFDRNLIDYDSHSWVVTMKLFGMDKLFDVRIIPYALDYHDIKVGNLLGGTSIAGFGRFDNFPVFMLIKDIMARAPNYPKDRR